MHICFVSAALFGEQEGSCREVPAGGKSTCLKNKLSTVRDPDTRLTATSEHGFPCTAMTKQLGA